MELPKIAQKMRDAGLPARVIADFLYYRQLALAGESGYLSEAEIEPLSSQDLVSYKSLPPSSAAHQAKAVIIKLNGGLGTSMGLEKAKSLIEVKDGLNFLDIIVKQLLSSSQNLPLVFMHSFATAADSREYLRKYDQRLPQSLPPDFLQNSYPRLKAESLALCDFADDTLNWSPPGHGDIYTALVVSGLLQKFLDAKIDYAFISNSDNLGASFDAQIGQYFAQSGLDFMMEVCSRTPMDKKGGHLAKKDGKIVLRELAQTRQQDLPEFQNIAKHKYFNTNNLWVNLHSLRKMGEFRLPLIVNPKTVQGQEVVQLETAMGSAISVFGKSKAMLVPRTRFMPVKKTSDLLLMRSDFFDLQADFSLSACRDDLPQIEVNPKFYGTLAQLEEKVRIVPSLRECRKLRLKNDYLFDKPHRFVGNCIV